MVAVCQVVLDLHANNKRAVKNTLCPAVRFTVIAFKSATVIIDEGHRGIMQSCRTDWASIDLL